MRIAKPKMMGARSAGLKAPGAMAPASMAQPMVSRAKGMSKVPGKTAGGEVSHPQSHDAFMKLGS